MRENIYARSEEKYVKVVVLYADGSDNLFYDATAKQEPVKKEELKDLFLKGVVVSKSNVLYAAICYKTDNIIGHDGATAKTFKCKAE